MAPSRMLPRDRWQTLGAFLTMVLVFVAGSYWNDYRIDQAERRITENQQKATRALARTVALQATNRAQQEQIRANAETAFALCDAAAGARDFWIGVRRSTLELLKDPTLSAIERSSNEHFVDSLNEVIAAAHLVAHRCD